MGDYSFRELEQLIYSFVCDLARRITVAFLNEEDERIKKNRDKKKYLIHDNLSGTVKTVYGDVEYKRRYYKDQETGEKIFLLDDALKMKTVGLYSENVVKMVLDVCKEMSFGSAAQFITEHTGRAISKTECWNIVQEVGSNIEEYQKQLAAGYEKKDPAEKKESKILFVESDGVWINHQLPNKKKGKKMELKLCTTYEGWDAEDEHRLVGKQVFGGNCSAKAFKKKTDAVINAAYNIDETEQIILNGDGAGWVRNLLDEDAIYQLDRFHVMKYIRHYISDKNIQGQIVEALAEKNPSRMLEVIKMYINSVDGQDAKAVENAKRLYSYLDCGDAVLNYRERGIKIPDPPEGIVYRAGGVQENQNCTLVCGRMKHKRRRWSESGSNNMVNVLCAFSNEDIDQYIRQPEMVLIEDQTMKEFLSAGRIPKKNGSGSRYLDLFSAAIPELQSSNTALTQTLRGLLCSMMASGN